MVAGEMVGGKGEAGNAAFPGRRFLFVSGLGNLSRSRTQWTFSLREE